MWCVVMFVLITRIATQVVLLLLVVAHQKPLRTPWEGDNVRSP